MKIIKDVMGRQRRETGEYIVDIQDPIGELDYWICMPGKRAVKSRHFPHSFLLAVGRE